MLCSLDLIASPNCHGFEVYGDFLNNSMNVGIIFWGGCGNFGLVFLGFSYFSTSILIYQLLDGKKAKTLRIIDTQMAEK